MGAVSRVVPAPPDQVWATLANGWTYGRWVVGTGAIRAVDVDFPAPDTRLHYRAGRWPLVKNGSTSVLTCDPDRLLELEVEGWPAGAAYVGLSLEPVPDDAGNRTGRSATEPTGGTRIVITEHPSSGPAKTLHNPVIDQVIRLRNVETLRRLEQTVLGQP